MRGPAKSSLWAGGSASHPPPVYDWSRPLSLLSFPTPRSSSPCFSPQGYSQFTVLPPVTHRSYTVPCPLDGDAPVPPCRTTGSVIRLVSLVQPHRVVQHETPSRSAGDGGGRMWCR